MTGRVQKLEWAMFAVTVKAGDGGGWEGGEGSDEPSSFTSSASLPPDLEFIMFL